MQRNPSCPHCCKSFRGQDPVGSLFPHMLQCGHTFCRSCLVKLMKMTRSQIICPICKNATPVKEMSIGDLPPDFYILGVLLTNSKKKINQAGEGKFVPRKDSQEVPCNITEVFKKFKEKVSGEVEDCYECMKQTATCFCENCGSFMCGPCFSKIHENSRILMMHQATPIEPKGDLRACRSHPTKPLDFFCLEDMQPVCANCVIIGSHKGHSVQSIEERNKKVIKDLEPAITKAEETMKAMLLAKKNICEAMPEVKHEASKVMNEVRTHFTRIHSILQAREKALTDSIDDYFEFQCDNIKQVQMSLETNIGCVLGAISEAKRAIQSNEIIQTTQLLALLEATTELPSLMEIPSSDRRLHFKPVIDDLSEIITKYGEVNGFDNERYTLKAFSEVSEDVIRDQTVSNADQQLIDRLVMDMHKSLKESAESQSVDNEELEIESTSSRIVNNGKVDSQSGKTKKAYRQRTYLHKEPPGERVIVTHIRSPWDFLVQRVSDQGKVNNMMGYLQKFCRTPAEKEYTLENAPSIGTMVCCQYSYDKKWYRAIIMTAAKSSADEDEVESRDDASSVISTGSTSVRSVVPNMGKDGYFEVVYIDYGNTEWVPISSIRKMCPKYKKMPELSIRCSLKDIVPTRNKSHWSKAAIHSFADMTVNKPLHMTTISNEGGVLYVDLHEVLVDDDFDSEAPASLRDALVFLEQACFVSELSVSKDHGRKSSTMQYFAPDLPTRHEYIDVMVSHVNSPHNFYVQEIVLGDQYLQKMMEDLQKYYKTEKGKQVIFPYIGMVCVAKYDVDDMWYRSQVVGLPGEGMVDVMYVDFGNVSRVHVTDIRMMSATFLKLPIQAMSCTMVDVAPIASSWDEGSAVRLAELSSTPLVICVQDVKDDVISVLVYSPQQQDDSSCLNAVLVAEGFAKSTGPGSINAAVFKKYHKKGTSQQQKFSRRTHSSSVASEVSKMIISNAETMQKASEKKKKLPYVGVKITHVVSPSCLYVQLKTEGQDGLESLQKAMMDHLMKTEVDTEEWQVNDIGAMIHSSNDFYSRAKILQRLPDNKAKVEMIDYGNTTVVTLSKLRRLASDLKSIQPFAIRCHLANVFPAGGKEWTKTACEYLACKLEELECYILKEDEMDDDGSFPIDLLYKKSWKELKKDADGQETELVSELLINDGLALPSPQKKKHKTQVNPKPKKSSDEESLIAHSRLSKYHSSGAAIKQQEHIPPSVTELNTDFGGSHLTKEDDGNSSLDAHHLPEVDQESQCSKNDFHKEIQVERKEEDIQIEKKQLPLGSISDHEYESDIGSIGSAASSSSYSIHSSGKGSNFSHSPTMKTTQNIDKFSVHSISENSVSTGSVHSIGKESIGKDCVHSVGKTSAHSKSSVHSICRDSCHSVHSIGKESVHSISKESVHSIGKDSVHSIGKDSVHSIGKDSVHSIGKGSVHSTGKDSVHSTGKDSVHSTGKDSVHSTGKDSVHSTGKISVQSTGKDSVLSTGKDSVHSIGKDSVHSIDKGSIHSSDKDSRCSISKSSEHNTHDRSVHHSDRSVDVTDDSPCSGTVSVQSDLVSCRESDQSRIHRSDRNNIQSSGKDSNIILGKVSIFIDDGRGSAPEPDESSMKNSAKSSENSACNSDASYMYEPITDSIIDCKPKYNNASHSISNSDNAIDRPSSDNSIDTKPASKPQATRLVADKFQKIDMDPIFTQEVITTIPDSMSEISSSDLDDEVIAGIIKSKLKRASRKHKSSHGHSKPVIPRSLPYVQYSPFEMPTSNSCEIVVTFINERGVIYGHEISEGKILLKQIMEELQNICEKQPVEIDINWKPGQACFAQFSLDGLWYRAKVLCVQNDNIWVQYVDFGNSEGVTGDKLRTATCFTDVPQQCLECILYGSRIINTANCWPTDALKFLYENLTVCRIERKGTWHRGTPLLVDITMPNGQNLRNALLNGPLYNSQDVIFCEDDNRIDAARLSGMSEKERDYFLGNHHHPIEMVQQDTFYCDSSLEFIPMELPDPGILFDVTITHADAPNQLYIQHFQGHAENSATKEAIKQLNQLIEMNAEIHHLAPSWPAVVDPFVGLCCAGLYGQDNQWYRAKILKVASSNLVTVQYVDFGTTERVTIDRLRYIPVDYFDLPIQSVLCEVFDLRPPSDIAEDCEMLPTTDWPLRSLTRLLEVIENKEQVAKVVQKNGEKPIVCLYQGFLATSTMASMQALPCNYVFLPLVEENLADNIERDV